MITIYGTKTCGRCRVLKTNLEKKNVEFTYTLLSDLSLEEQQQIMTDATQNGKKQLPIIIKDNTYYELTEAMKW